MSKLLINGKWSDGITSEPIINKYTGTPFAEMAVASLDDVDAAVAGARSAFQKIKLTPYERFEILSKAAGIIKSRTETIMETMIKEAGFTRTECENEIKRTQQTLLLCAEEAKRITGSIVPMEATPGLRDRIGFTIRVPRGVVCAITPFNAPLSTVTHKVGPALAAGNSVVLKPAGYTPLTSVQLCKALLDAGLPPELLTLIHGPGSQVGRALLGDPRLAFYTFTGSTAVGLEVQKAARLRGVSLELGSIATTILCHDADLNLAIPKVIRSCFWKAGQICTSTQRLLVDRKRSAEVLERMAEATANLTFGDPSDPATNVGPMISEAEAKRAQFWVAEAVSQGARVEVGGACHGSVMEPTLLHRVTPSMRVACEEIFAPVVSIIEFDGIDDAIDKANSTAYGLSAGIFTADVRAAMQAAHRLEFGGIHINESSSARVDVMPFGGVKESGIGHEGPYHAIREMTEERCVTIAY